MKEILDQEIESSPGEERSRKACVFFIANLFCVLIIISITYFIRFNVRQDMWQDIYMGLIVIFILLSILGIRNAILSLIKKEKWTYFKIIGLIGNVLFFGIVLLLFISNIVDLLNFMSS